MPKTKIHATKNDLPTNAKRTVISLLNKNLAALIDLSLVTKQAHWNLKGMQFIAVHEMLDTFRSELDVHTDTIAERAVQLGGTALGTVQTVAETSILSPYPEDIYDVKDHLSALIEHYSAAANLLRQSIKDADEAGDDNSTDIFTNASRGLDKALWFLEAHTQS